MNNIDMLKTKAAEAEDMARKVWLAGLGAYGKSFEDAKGRLETLSTESSKMFADLVAKGEALEAEGKGKFDQVKTQFTAKADIDNRFEAVRTKLGFTGADADADADADIVALNAKVDALTAAVAKLSK
jgi:polyhydroxyalkanoate synthesis regulator phasin